MGINDMDRINAVQQKLCEVKTWVDETLRILNYVCIDEAHKQFKSTNAPLSKAATYPGQLPDITTLKTEESGDEECSS